MYKTLHIKPLIIIGLLSILVLSCAKKEEFPIEPHIEFAGFAKINNGSGIDDKAILTISFTDGDGDIGLSEGDTFPPYNSGSDYYYNFFAKYMERINGILTEIKLPISGNARLPLVSTSAANKAIKGEIEIELFINNPLSIHDTIAFEIYIVDRALHKSNTVRTPEFKIKKF